MGGTGTGSPRPQPSSLRSAKPTWHQKGRPGAGTGPGGNSSSSFSGLDATRQRVIVFVAGGMTYSEVRSAYQLSDKLNKDVYFGSSHVFTPHSFIDSLKHFGKASAGASGGGGALAGRSHGSGHGSSNGATRLSAPENDVSGIRSAASKAKHAFHQGYHETFSGGTGSGGADSRSPPLNQYSMRPAAAAAAAAHHHGQGASYDQSLHSHQNLYDKRFASSGPAPPPVDSGSVSPSTRGASLPSQHSPQRRGGVSQAPANGNGGSNTGGGHGHPHLGMSPSVASSLNANASSQRTSSPAPSSMSDTSRLKDGKKRLKNPFTFKKT